MSEEIVRVFERQADLCDPGFQDLIDQIKFTFPNGIFRYNDVKVDSVGGYVVENSIDILAETIALFSFKYRINLALRYILIRCPEPYGLSILNRVNIMYKVRNQVGENMPDYDKILEEWKSNKVPINNTVGLIRDDSDDDDDIVKYFVTITTDKKQKDALLDVMNKLNGLLQSNHVKVVKYNLGWELTKAGVPHAHLVAWAKKGSRFDKVGVNIKNKAKITKKDRESNPKCAIMYEKIINPKKYLDDINKYITKAKNDPKAMKFYQKNGIKMIEGNIVV